MIIELFGPPGVGKTTFACALASRLRERGRVVKLVLSYRPTEHPVDPLQDPARHRATAAARRLIRPVVELLAMSGHLFGNSHAVNTAANLMRILPPKDIIWSIRLRQYILRLSRSWHRASPASDIVLFDQGFVQAVCSLALLGRAADGKLIALALDSIPKSDFLIRLDAPREILEARLAARQRLQSRSEQLFELDLKTNLESVRITDHLHELLQKRGRPVTRVNSADQRSLCEAMERIEREVTARLGTERGGNA